MYKERYKMMKSPSCKQKKDIGKRLTILDWMRLRDKSTLPKSLQYKDEGGMYHRIPQWQILRITESMYFLECITIATTSAVAIVYGILSIVSPNLD